MALRCLDAQDPRRALEDSAQRIRELELSLHQAQAAEKQQKDRADMLERSLRAMSRVSGQTR